MIIITGATGVGKTDYSYDLISRVPAKTVIVNGDMGQMYTPLTIGTAKPAWKESAYAHYLFDVNDKPIDCNARDYRMLVGGVLQSLNNEIAVVVGGSTFYLENLLYCMKDQIHTHEGYTRRCDGTWEELYIKDPVRAVQIHPHDQYRIDRALDIINGGVLASACAPVYAPLCNYIIIVVMRARHCLYDRINERVITMLDGGWIDEVSCLSDEWREFVRKKNIIGYSEIIDYCAGYYSKQDLVEQIQQKTRHYAKRQETALRRLAKKGAHVLYVSPDMPETYNVSKTLENLMAGVLK